MMDWQRIGLEAHSHDLGAIKRAYARTVKVTRPDDDPQAYQLLREAYDRLVQQARHVAAMEAAMQAARAAEAAEEEAQRGSGGRDGDDGATMPADEATLVGESEMARIEVHASSTVLLTSSAIPAWPSPEAEVPASSPASLSASSSAEAPPAEAPPAEAPTTAPPSAKPAGAPAPEPPPRADAPPLAAPVVTSTRSPAPIPAPPSPAVPPERFELLTPPGLAQWLQALSKEGAAALRAALPHLRQQLHEQPLEWRADTSRFLAMLAVSESDYWPRELHQLLFEHFDWGQDVRSERELGTELVWRLVQLADEYVERPVRDHHLLHQYGEAISFSRLMGQRRSTDFMEALVLALLKPVLDFQIREMSQALWRRFGFAVSFKIKRWKQIQSAAKAMIGAATAMLVYLLYSLLTLSFTEGAERGFNGAVATLLGTGLAALGVFIVARIRQWAPFHHFGYKTLKLSAERVRVGVPVVGLVLLAVAAGGGVVGQVETMEHWSLLRLLALPALVLALPRSIGLGATALMLSMLVIHANKAVEEVFAPITVFWVMLGAQAYELGWIRPDAKQPPSALWSFPGGSLKEWLVLGTIGLPVLVAWITERAGLYLVWIAFALADAPVQLGMRVTGLLPWPVLWLALGTTLGLQRLGVQWGRRALKALVPTP